MLVVLNNQRFLQWTIGNPVEPLETDLDVIIAFDPSKTNMAMFVGTPDGQGLDAIEFSGNNRKKGPVMDTTQYCLEVRAYLKAYLKNVKIYMVAIEQAIQKKGAEYYRSSMVLTEIRGNMLNFFLEEYGIKVIEINNWSWKAGVLPEGYRGMYEKGSKKFFVQNMPDSSYANFFEADMTDCICIYQYVCKTMVTGYQVYCNQRETAHYDYTYAFTSLNSDFAKGLRTMAFNDKFSIPDNIIFYVNRYKDPFCIEIPIDCVKPEDVYGHTHKFEFQNIHDNACRVVVMRDGDN